MSHDQPDCQLFPGFPRACSVLLLVATSVPGCQHAEMAAEYAQRREERLARTATLLVENETIRAQKLERVGTFLEREGEYRDEQWAAVGPAIESLLEYEFEHWQRAQPRIAEEAARQLRGQPEDIEPTAIRMFY